MDYTTIATVDEVHSEVIREVLADAGIAVRITSLRPEQMQALQLVSRPRVDVEVDGARVEEARALLHSFEQSGEAAALEQAEAAVAPEYPPGPESLWRRGWRWILGDRRQPPRSDGAGDDGPHA